MLDEAQIAQIKTLEQSLKNDVSALGSDISSLATTINELAINVARQTVMIDSHKELVSSNVQTIMSQASLLTRRVEKNADKITELERNVSAAKAGLKTAMWFWGTMWTIGTSIVGVAAFLYGG